MSNLLDFLQNKALKLNRPLKIGFMFLGLSNTAVIDRLFSEFNLGTLGEFNGNGCPFCNFDNNKIFSLRVKNDCVRDILKDKTDYFRVFSSENFFDDICEDLIFVPPSVRRDGAKFEIFRKCGVEFVSDFDIFFHGDVGTKFCVTGSDGKSTVTTLVKMLINSHDLSNTFDCGNVGKSGFSVDKGVNSCGKVKNLSAFACGNIGVPFLSVPVGDFAYVCEMSSFQLSYVSPKCQRGVITNISPNHLNWHKSFSEYIEAKFNLLKNCRDVVLNADDVITCERLKGNRLFAVFSYSLSFSELRKRFSALHFAYLDNGYICFDGFRIVKICDLMKSDACTVKNFLCALCLSEGYYSIDNATRVALNFRGLAHRCELFASFSGIDFIDSSIDTTPTRTLNTLLALGRRVKIILGGRDKGLSIEPLIPVLAKYADYIYIYGECGRKFFDALSCDNFTRGMGIHLFSTLDELLNRVLPTLYLGDILLLSPAAASFGEFSDFEVRGEFFKDKVFKFYS